MPDIFVSEHKKTKNSSPIISDSPKKIDKPLEEVSKYDTHSSGRPHIFSSISKNPRDMSFQNQEADEKILLFIRKSLVTNIPWIFITSVFLTLPVLLFIFLPVFGNPLPFIPFNFQLVLLASYYLVIVSYAYVSFITWYFNIALVTNIKIIDVDFTGLVYKDVASTKLSLVQDVSYTQIGVLRNFFNYGDVLVQTAGAVDNFVFEAAPQPESIVHLIGDLIGEDGTV